MLLKILQVISYIAIFQSVILIINLLIRKDNSFSRYILISLFLTFGLFLTGNLVILYSGIYYYKIYHLMNLIIFLAAPLLYIYFLSRLDYKSSLNKRDFIHLIPFIGVLFTISPVFIFSSKKFIPFNNYGSFVMGLLFLQNLFYLLKILKTLKEKKQTILPQSQNFYDYEATRNSVNHEITWIQKILLSFFIVMILKTSFIITCRIFSIMEICVIFTGIFFLLFFLLINNIVLFGLSKSSIFEYKIKYQHSLINNALKDEYLEKLKKAMLIDKLYLDPLISMDKLSKNLKIPRNYLSQLINEYFALNFNEMINQFRINEAKKLINSEGENLPIIDIAYKVGFNSKSTFNTAFKRYTHLTPSTYLLKNSN